MLKSARLILTSHRLVDVDGGDVEPGWHEATALLILALVVVATGIFIHRGASPNSRIYRQKQSDLAFQVLGIFVIVLGFLTAIAALAIGLSS